MMKRAVIIGWTILGLVMAGAVHGALPFFDSQGDKLPTLAPMIEKVTPAVVNISTVTKQREVFNPLMQDPFFRRFFEQRPPQYRQRKQASAGSGVIIDAKKGIVVTNHHVVEGAVEITVSLNDGRSFEAKLLGSDAEVDVAVLEIIDGKRLSEIKLSDSDELLVGDFVVAVGNPFGLGQTVTTGVVSALGRSGLGIDGYEDFIQTDASINPGNSGGALVNLAGELVGINTAIISRTGGSVGIGFAIPTNMANVSIQQILEYGEVRRGALGVAIQDVKPDVAKTLGLKKGQTGVLISEVVKDSEAEKAGLKAGDVVIELNGKAVKSASQLRNSVGMAAIGTEFEVTVVRDGKLKSLEVKVGERSSGEVDADAPVFERLRGAVLEENSKAGIEVVEVQRGSAAFYAGLRPGDLIVGVNRKPVRTLKAFTEAAGDGTLILHVKRGMKDLVLVISS